MDLLLAVYCEAVRVHFVEGNVTFGSLDNFRPNALAKADCLDGDLDLDISGLSTGVLVLFLSFGDFSLLERKPLLGEDCADLLLALMGDDDFDELERDRNRKDRPRLFVSFCSGVTGVSSEDFLFLLDDDLPNLLENCDFTGSLLMGDCAIRVGVTLYC